MKEAVTYFKAHLEIGLRKTRNNFSGDSPVSGR
jgi:hypothetical protein